jgi:glutathione S-transferase
MKLLCSPTSPFSSKVRMAARYLDLDITEIRVDTNAGPAILVDNNPLGKIPTLLTKDGQSIFDSRAITHYLGRMKGKRLYPVNDRKRTEAEILEALCDGACDCLLSIVYERRFRTEEKIFQPWIDRQWTKAKRTLDQLSAEVPKIGRKLHGGHFAMAAMLGYLQLRFAGEWEEDHSDLIGWLRTFEKKFPDYQALKPQG